MWRFLLPLLLFPQILLAETVTLTWDPVTLNTDGTPCTNLQGYKVYKGVITSGSYGAPVALGNVTTYQATVSTGKSYFAVTAFNTNAKESAKSNEVLVTIAAKVPAKPSGLTAQGQTP